MNTIQEEILQSLRVLAKIADEYDANGLDEVRPVWVEKGLHSPIIDKVELLAGRGGKQLLTLGDCLKARVILRKLERRES